MAQHAMYGEIVFPFPTFLEPGGCVALAGGQQVVGDFVAQAVMVTVEHDEAAATGFVVECDHLALKAGAAEHFDGQAFLPSGFAGVAFAEHEDDVVDGFASVGFVMGMVKVALVAA